MTPDRVEPLGQSGVGGENATAPVQHMEQGQLVIADFHGRDVLWTVIGTNKAKGTARLIALLDGFVAEVTTKPARPVLVGPRSAPCPPLPNGWRVVGNAETVKLDAERDRYREALERIHGAHVDRGALNTPEHMADIALGALGDA